MKVSVFVATDDTDAFVEPWKCKLVKSLSWQNIQTVNTER
jgi:hypothetical protein